MEPMTFSTPESLELDLRIPSGTIRIRATESTETRVHLTGERDPDEVAIRLSPRAEGGHHLLVEQRRTRALDWFGRGDRLRADIEIPRGAYVGIASASADAQIQGEIGALNFRSASGDLSFESVRNNVSVKVASGSVSGGTVGGDLSIHGISGDLRIRSVRGEARVKVVSGDTDIDRAEKSVQAVSVSGDVILDHVCSGEIQVRTVSGNVHIGVLPGLRVWLDLNTRAGSATSELDSADGVEEAAAVRIQALSLSGDLRVRRSASAAAQPIGT